MNEHLKLKCWTLNHTQPSVFVVHLSSTAVIYARKLLSVTTVSPIYAELIEFGDKQCEHVITRLGKTEQTRNVLETEIIAGVFPPVAEDNTEYSIESYSALKIYVTVMNTLVKPHVFSLVESGVLQIEKETLNMPTKFLEGNKIELHTLKIIVIFKLPYCWRYVCLWLSFYLM